MKSIQNEIGVKSLIKRTESSLFEFLSVKTLSKKNNGCRDFSAYNS